MARPKSDENKQLTDTELQIMNILWELEASTVHEVLTRLSEIQKKEYAYTTVSTLLRVLEKKEAVESKKEGRGHLYSPLIPKEKYQKKATKHLVNHLFEGQPAALVKNLLGSGYLSKEELKEVQQLLNEKVKK